MSASCRQHLGIKLLAPTCYGEDMLEWCHIWVLKKKNCATTKKFIEWLARREKYLKRSSKRYWAWKPSLNIFFLSNLEKKSSDHVILDARWIKSKCKCITLHWTYDVLSGTAHALVLVWKQTDKTLFNFETQFLMCNSWITLWLKRHDINLYVYSVSGYYTYYM